MPARDYDAIAQKLGAASDHAADTLPPLELQDLEQFATQPAARWLVRGILPPDSLVVVFGSAKGGKTFCTTDMLMHAAHGMDWHGHAVPRPLRVAFLAGEGRNGLRVRLHAWRQHHDSAELTGAFKVLPTSFSLPDRLEELIELLRPFRPDVVVPDTLNAFFGVGDENSTQDMTRFVAALRRVREALACSVVVLHHTALADAARERGSGVLRGAADVIIQVGKDEAGSGSLGFQVVTGRDIEPMEQPLALRLERANTDWLDEDGETLVSCVVRAAAQPVTLAGRGTRPLGEAQATLLTCARELTTDAPADPAGWVTLARTEVAARAKARGVSRQSISSAWQPLQARGYLRLIEPGSVMLRARA
jgi:AAA domain-containing protein